MLLVTVGVRVLPIVWIWASVTNLQFPWIIEPLKDIAYNRYKHLQTW